MNRINEIREREYTKTPLTNEQKEVLINEYDKSILTPAERDKFIEDFNNEWNEEHELLESHNRESESAELSDKDWLHSEFSEFSDLLTPKNLERILDVHQWFLENRIPSNGSSHIAIEATPFGKNRITTGIIDSIESLKQAIQVDPEVRKWSKFKRECGNAVAFIKMRKMIESGEAESMTLEEIANKIGADKQKVSVWKRGVHTPRLIARFEGNPRANLRACIQISDFSDILSLVRQNPHVKESKHFPEWLVHSWIFIEYRKLVSSGVRSNFTYGELSRVFGVHPRRLWAWTNSNEVPVFVNQLVIQEVARRVNEDGRSLQSENHRICYENVYEAFSSFRRKEKRNIEPLSRAIERIYRPSENRCPVVFAELFPFHQTGPRWLKQVASYIKSNQSQIEMSLNTSLQDELSAYETLRIGIVANTLYIWRKDTKPFTWINLLSDELFYFSAKGKKDLIHHARAHLNLGGNNNLAALTNQLCNHYHNAALERNAWSDFKQYQRNYVSGEALHFLLDVVGEGLQDLDISHIGQSSAKKHLGQIVGPDFSVEPKEFLARLYAIIVSDGTVFKDGRMTYYETRNTRYERVKNLIGQLGEVAISDRSSSTDLNELYIPPIIGRLLIRVGMPVGARCIQNVGLPEFILEGDEHILRAYLEEVIPEDGYFNPRDMRFSISRTTVLLQPDVAYRISPEELDIVLRYGDKGYLTFGYADREFEVVQIRTEKLLEIAQTSNKHISSSALRLLCNVFKNRSNLIDGERKICSRLGIGTRVESRTLTYYVDSGRLSSSWELCTRSLKDAMRWAILAPPNDVFKRNGVQEFIQTRQDLHPDN